MAKSTKSPPYLELYKKNILKERIARAKTLLHKCTVCPHECGVKRDEGELGLCRTGSMARVASFGPHFGEESPLVGQKGSGTIFFEGCSLLCVFCQNYDISHIDNRGDTSADVVTDAELASLMINLQEKGCHNINLVTPSHVVPQFLSALPTAIEQGLRIPIVYNTSGYDSVETLLLLEDVVDIYMPDCKFWTTETAKLYTKATNYPEIMQKALKEMHRQAGDLVIDENGIALRGLLVRHLVMPGYPEETRGVMKFLAEEISTETYINVMDQYRPCYKAHEFDKINIALSAGEYEQAVSTAREFGLHRLDEREWKKFFRLLGL